MKIKFFDESGFRLPEAGLRHYGFSPVGVPCVEVPKVYGFSCFFWPVSMA